MILLVTATGTDAGKTTLTRGLARAARRRGIDVVGIKPFETGVVGTPVDAVALERAAEAGWPGPWFRAASPVAPWAATAMGEGSVDWDGIVDAIRAAERKHELVLVEGAGGVRVPIDAEREVRDLASTLDARVVLVAPDVLGVLSYVLTAVDALCGASTSPVVVLRGAPRPDPSVATNGALLEKKLGRPIHRFPYVEGDDDALARAVEEARLLDACFRAAG
jgi:dethiobiotin synthase